MGWVVRVPREMLQQQAQALAEALDNGPMPARPLGSRSGEGDPHRLRGIPIVGARGIGGAIPGTKPEQAVMLSDVGI